MATAGQIEHEVFVAYLGGSLGSADTVSDADCIALDVPAGSTVGGIARHILGVFAADEAQVEAAVRVRQ